MVYLEWGYVVITTLIVIGNWIGISGLYNRIYIQSEVLCTMIDSIEVLEARIKELEK